MSFSSKILGVTGASQPGQSMVIAAVGVLLRH